MSKDKAFGEGAAGLTIEVGEEKVESKKEKEETKEKKPAALENKIQELKERGAERVAEVEERLNKLMEQTDGWDAESQPEYKKIMRETIVGYLSKQIGKVKKLEGRTLIADDAYGEALQVFDRLERRIVKMSIAEDEKNPKYEALMMVFAKGSLTDKGELSFTGDSGYRPNSWENMAEWELERTK